MSSKQEENIVETCQSKMQDQKGGVEGGKESHLLGAHAITHSPFSLNSQPVPSGLFLVPSVLMPWVSVALEGSPCLFLHPRVFKITSVYFP